MPPPEDDSTIRDDDRLLRRIPPWHLVRDDNTKSHRISSAAFDDPPDSSSMSVSIESTLVCNGLGAEHALRNHEDFGLVALSVALVREHGQGVVRRPLPDDPAHGEVVGSKTRSVRKAFARNAVWIKE